MPRELSFPGTGTRAALEEVAVLPTSSSETGEEGSSSLGLLLMVRTAVQLIEPFSCTHKQLSFS
mgnify:CR=1 FL=1